jgi:hypothetical protein
VIPDARELHRVITASVRESGVPLTEAQRGELLPNIARLMLAAFLEEHAR